MKPKIGDLIQVDARNVPIITDLYDQEFGIVLDIFYNNVVVNLENKSRFIKEYYDHAKMNKIKKTVYYIQLINLDFDQCLLYKNEFKKI